jgi:hypothetical protein
VSLRDELLERNATHETLFRVELSESQAADIASGYVPDAVKAMMVCMLDWRRQDELRAQRPIRAPRKRKTA